MDAKQLRLLLPKDAQDVETARNLVSLGAEALAPVVPDMVRRLKDHDSPVADVYCEFFAAHGERFAHVFGDFLGRSSMPDLKNVIVKRVLTCWSRDGVEPLKGVLTMLLTGSDFYDTDLFAIRLLKTHNLADSDWLAGWLAFKRRRLSQLTAIADQIASEFSTPSNAP